ncbi:alkaline phosphatase family protein [Vibrio ostreicida]|nr:alkaline phosphatase family protein [Vibrio ostreicida]NPD08597.1 sulfatase-like hydrolase/transferase [Vibrio ostreicida]
MVSGHKWRHWMVLLSVLISTSVSANQKKVLLVGIDGMQYQHIDQLPTPGFDRLKITKAYTGGIKGRFSQQKTISGPGWATILTGVWANKHKVTSNNVGPADPHWPSLFRQIYRADHDAKLYSFSTWGTINTLYFPHDMPLLEGRSEGGSDQDSLLRAIDVIDNQNPDFIFIHLDEPDSAGHSHGWGTEYDKAIKGSDARLARLLDAVEKREREKAEDWLVLVTTDHGRNSRTGKGHGAQTTNEKTIFIASNQTLNQTYLQYISVFNQDFGGIYSQPAQTFIVPTILAFMGIEPPIHRLDGLPLLGEIKTQKVFSTIDDRRCGLEWDADVGQPVSLSRYEHVAKFDCNDSADPLWVNGDTIYANIFGSSCGLQWQATKGSPSPMGSNEHIAKFDCNNDGDPLTISENDLFSWIDDQQCGFEWHAKRGRPMTLGNHEHVAKFDCDGHADPLSFE